MPFLPYGIRLPSLGHGSVEQARRGRVACRLTLLTMPFKGKPWSSVTRCVRQTQQRLRWKWGPCRVPFCWGCPAPKLPLSEGRDHLERDLLLLLESHQFLSQQQSRLSRGSQWPPRAPLDLGCGPGGPPDCSPWHGADDVIRAAPFLKKLPFPAVLPVSLGE